MSTRCSRWKSISAEKKATVCSAATAAAICRELGQTAKAEEYEVQRKKYCPEA